MANKTLLENGLGAVLDSAATQIISKGIIALIILLVGFILGRFVNKLVTRILHELELDKILKNLTKTKIRLEKGISIFSMYLIYLITIIIVLNQIGLTTTILHIVVGAIILFIVLSLLIGIKDFIPNAFAGFILFKKRELNMGDIIKFKEIQGRITKIGLTQIVVEKSNKDIIFIPASALSKTELIVLKRAEKKKK